MVFSINLIVNLSVALLAVSSVTGDDLNSLEFDVIPGGARKHFESEQWHGITCIFTYVCQGGTKERWVVTLRRDDDFNYKCVVERPDGSSYLFFQEFEVLVTGAAVEGAEVAGKDLNSPLTEENYIVDKERNSVKSTKEFKAELNRVDVFLTRQKGTKEDL